MMISLEGGLFRVGRLPFRKYFTHRHCIVIIDLFRRLIFGTHP